MGIHFYINKLGIILKTENGASLRLLFNGATFGQLPVSYYPPKDLCVSSKLILM